ncbi:hypothetical protein KO317_03985 [Candidatus Micrarchaeota archaeon]|jgi:sugar-specific transcriptional regulator TrmB|nr:hypothetical protein [Candidatus Micrarchaeota archaeon]
MDETKLKALGLSDPEVKIYVALLKSGPLSASQLSKKTGMYRPYVYDTLENLIGKDLVTYTIRKSKKEFECAPPSALKKLLKKEQDQLKQKQGVVDSLVPKLEKIYNKPFTEFIIENFEGENAHKDLNEYILKIQKKKNITEVKYFGPDFIFDKKIKATINKKINPLKTGILIFNDYTAFYEKDKIFLIKNKNIYNLLNVMFNQI